MRLHRISIAVLVLALFGLVALPGSAQAQEQGAQQQDPATYESLSSALEDLDTHVQALEGTEVQDVEVVKVEKITSGLDDTQLQTLRTTYQDADTDALESAVQNNETISSELNNKQDVEAGDVVAVSVQQDGQTVLYVDPNGVLDGGGTSGF